MPKDDVRASERQGGDALAERWRSNAAQLRLEGGDYRYYEALEECAGELDALTPSQPAPSADPAAASFREDVLLDEVDEAPAPSADAEGRVSHEEAFAAVGSLSLGASESRSHLERLSAYVNQQEQSEREAIGLRKELERTKLDFANSCDVGRRLESALTEAQAKLAALEAISSGLATQRDSLEKQLQTQAEELEEANAMVGALTVDLRALRRRRAAALNAEADVGELKAKLSEAERKLAKAREERHELRNAAGNLIEAMKVSGSQPPPTVYRAFQAVERALVKSAAKEPTGGEPAKPHGPSDFDKCTNQKCRHLRANHRQTCLMLDCPCKEFEQSKTAQQADATCICVEPPHEPGAAPAWGCPRHGVFAEKPAQAEQKDSSPDASNSGASGPVTAVAPGVESTGHFPDGCEHCGAGPHDPCDRGVDHNPAGERGDFSDDIDMGRTWPYGVTLDSGYMRRFTADSLEPADPAQPQFQGDGVTRFIQELAAVFEHAARNADGESASLARHVAHMLQDRTFEDRTKP